jgi:hypothetical protein
MYCSETVSRWLRKPEAHKEQERRFTPRALPSGAEGYMTQKAGQGRTGRQRQHQLL